jgi:hypothetical protein
VAEGGGRSNRAASWRAEGIHSNRPSRDEISGASPATALAAATVIATGWLLRTEIWHCPQHSREERAGPFVSPRDECPCDLRQQLALLSLQQQGASFVSCANARNGIGSASRNATSALANQLVVRQAITLSIRPDRAKTSVRSSKERQNGASKLKAPMVYDD